MTERIIIYHKNCADGFGAALAAWLKFGDNATEYVAAHYGDTPPDVENKDVFIVDFSYKREVLLNLKDSAKTLVVLDHHKTSAEDLEGLPFAVFDMDKSGAVIAWEYFHPGEEVPLLLKYIQDRDLWQWKLPYSKEISSGLRLEPMEFDRWRRFLLGEDFDNLKNIGETVSLYEKKLISGIVEGPIGRANIGGYLVPCVNVTSLISEIGNILARGNPFSAMYFETDVKRIYSLRSDENGIDVSEIAKVYGGGGHARAAGFTVQKPEITLNLPSRTK